MNILQVHLELADIPRNIPSFEGEDIEFGINVENSENPIHFTARQQFYIFDKEKYSETGLDASEIVQMYRGENLYDGARKIDEQNIASYRSELIYSQDEISHNRDDLECYDKLILVLNETETCSLASLDIANPSEQPFTFKYCDSYIALYKMFTVTLWSGIKKLIHIPKENELPPFISNGSSEVHYRLRFKKIPFDC